MSDFVTGLRGDLVDAAARHRRRGRLGRAAGPMHPRAWRPAVAFGAAAVTATIVAIVLATSALEPPPSQPARPQIVAQVKVGGVPQDAVLADGSLWVADFSGRVSRIDAASRRVTARIDVSGNSRSITAGDGQVWVMGSEGQGVLRARLIRIEARTSRVAEYVPVGLRPGAEPPSGWASSIAFGAGGLWLIPNGRRSGIQRIDATSHAVTARIAFSRASALAIGGDSLWALGEGGTVVEVAGVPGEVRRLSRAAPNLTAFTENSITADSTGAWVSSPDAGKVLRIESGDVVREVGVGAGPGALALADDALWVATGDELRGRFGLKRIDPATGRIMATLNLGGHEAKALVPVGRDVWVVAADGTALLVRNRAQAG